MSGAAGITMASAVDAAGDPIPTSAVLMASSKHIGASCRSENTAFIACKKRDPKPERCLDKGREVTHCVLNLPFPREREHKEGKRKLSPGTMASTFMASSTSTSKLPNLPIPKEHHHHHHYHRSLPAAVVVMRARANPPPPEIGIQRLLVKSLSDLPRIAVLASVPVATSLATAMPALAEQMEKAALFDFNLTLPAIAIEFLLLMVALDKIYFTPLGNFMDERDAAIRAKLGDVKDTSQEVKQLEDQAAAIMKAARAEISAALNQMKKETTQELEGKLAEGRKKVEAELAEALANLERQKEETIKSLDSQIAALSDEIVKKVLPTA